MDRETRKALLDVNDGELRHLVFQLYGIRVPSGITRAQLFRILGYKGSVTREDFAGTDRLNLMRKELTEFIAKYRDRLSLNCTGLCHTHTDAVVQCCWFELLQDTGVDIDETELNVGPMEDVPEDLE